MEEDANFKTYLMMKRMKIPLINIRNKIEADGKGYTAADIDLFADQEEIAEANQSMVKAVK